MTFITRNEDGLVLYGSGYSLTDFGVIDFEGIQVDASVTEETATLHEGELPDGVSLRWSRFIDGEFEDVPRPPPNSPLPSEVDAERDRRIAAGFVFRGVRFQSRPEDRENMAGASLAALAAMTAGAQPGDLRWHGGSSDFVWIAEDNSLHPMDAQTMFAFGQTAMAHKQAMIFAARSIKDMEPVPADYTDDGYWP